MFKQTCFHRLAHAAIRLTECCSAIDHRTTFTLLLLTIVCVASPTNERIAAQPPASPQSSADQPIERELFVPFEDLSVLLGGETRRVFMTREEYAQLLSQAKRAPEEALPQETAILSAEYDGTIEDGRASLSGKLHIEIFGSGLQAVPLGLSGVGIRSAQLDGQPAALVESGGSVLLAVEGRGKHTLALDMVLPLATAAAEQSLSWQVPVPPATTFHLTVQGDVEMKSGAAIISRRVDSDAGVTHFELLPTNAQMNLVMSLNNRRLRAETTVLARGVLVDELTNGYERLHASLSMNILHGASDEFSIAIPDGFEITQVATPLLARWSIEEGNDEQDEDEDKDEGKNANGKVLKIQLRQLTTQRVVIQVRADRTQPRLEGWQMPKLVPLGVAGFAGVVGVLLEDQLTSGAIETRGLIPIDNQVLTAALPESVLAAEAGMPRVRPLVTYYAAQANFELATDFARQPAELYATTNLLLTLSDRGLEMDGGFALLPEKEKLFSFEFRVPAGWSVDTVRTADGAALAFERYSSDDGARVRVQLPTGLAPRATFNVLFHATYTPTDWLGDWTEQTVALPAFAIRQEEGVHESGAVAVRALDDLRARPLSTSGLIVLTESEKSKYGFGDVAASLAWRYTEEPWRGELSVTRTAPRITGRALSFFRFSPEALTAHFELSYSVEQARAQRVSFSLPENTPAEIAIRGLGDTLVKESSSRIVDGRRHWDVQLAEKKTGRIRLAIDFTQPLADAPLKAYPLPQIRTENVAYQSGLIAVEGAPELDVTVVEHPRSVDMGELVDAEYQAGKRLLGVFSYVGSADQTTVDVVRRLIHALPTTIVQRAELVTLVGASGIGQTAARFALRTKALYIEVRLPAEATLWSAMVDGQPALPQRQGEQTIIALPTAPADQSRDLQIVYEQPIDPLMLRGQVDLVGPTLWQRLERDAASEPVPMADLKWELVLPEGYRLAHVGGTVTETDAAPRFRWQEWLDWFVKLGGGRRGTAVQGYKSTAHFQPLPRGGAEATVEGLQTAPSLGAAPFDAESDQAPPSGAPMFDQFGAMAAAPPVNQPAADQPAANQPAFRQPLPSAQQPGRLGQTRGAEGRAKSTWALAGMRSLAIDLSGAKFGQHVAFTSLGVDPVLRATLVDQRRWQWLGLACGLIVFALGLWRVANKMTSQLRYAGLVTVIALLLPPLTGWQTELEPVVEAVIAAALAILVVAIFRSLATSIVVRVSHFRQRRSAGAAQAVSTGAVLLLLAWSSHADALRAQEVASKPMTGPVPVSNLSELESLVQALRAPGQVAIPRDAIVVPYDPAALDGFTRAEKLLVPYDRYVELWNAAHPERQLAPKPPVTAYAWSGAQYRAMLEGDNSLRLVGSLTIHVYADGDVSVPLAIGGGVLESASVDGQPARLQVVQPQAPAQAAGGAAPQQAAQQQQRLATATAAQPAETLFMLHLEGKGRKELAIEVRLKIEKRGGWRVVDGRVPAAPATGLALTVPEAKTEVRFESFHDRTSVETEKPRETIDTALPTSGRMQLQWRAKIAEAAIDQGLSVEAKAAFDVQEDGLKFAWHGTFDFRRSRRESFTLLVPSDYTIEKVVGNNIRGWNIEPVDGGQQLTVDLLAAVAERETLTLFMMRAYTADPDEPATIAVPVVRVPDAMLQQGQLAVRRSSLLELRTNRSTGLSRIDTPDDSAWLTEPVDTSPLPLRPYQAFRFSQVPYTLELTAEPSTSQVRVTAQTLLKLSQLESTLESRLILHIAERAVHHVRISVPANWRLDPPQLAVGYDWNVEPAEAGQQWLDIYFARGVAGEVPIVLQGKLEQSLAAEDNGDVVPLPRIAVEDVSEQSGDVVVASDPAFDVRAEQLQGCETGLLASAESWLAADQRSLARLLIHHTASDYSGQLRVTRRAPQVTAFSVTNVKVTDRAIEETIYIELTIRSAGIRQVSIVVPASLSRARVRGRLIRQQTWTQVGTETDSPWRLVVELQEDVMGQYSLILEHDRLPGSGEQAVPIPTIETGTTEHRFITLENSGRDELLVGERSGVEPLQRSQAQWRFLNELLGGKATEAFVVRQSDEAPRLSFKTRSRAAVETVGARIGIAQTLLVVDENGAYRAVQEYRVENRTEQYLEIELPAGAKLWTVMVAGEPVKPMASLLTSAAANQTGASQASVRQTGVGERLRIPLVKTAAGDLDYAVTLKYGGVMEKPGAMRVVRFPLVKTVNINVELSQVRLRLPESERWFNFGGSMGRVFKPEEFEAGWLSFRTRQLNELTELLSQTTDSDFSKARATSNLKQLGQEIEAYRSRSDVAQTQSKELREQLASNSAAWADAQKQLQAPETPLNGAMVQPTNRELLNQRFEQQDNARSYNVASEKGANFQQAATQAGQQAAQQPSTGQQQAVSAGEFDAKWLAGNALKSNLPPQQGGESLGIDKRLLDRVLPADAERKESGAAVQGQAAAKPAAPKLAAPSSAGEKKQAEPSRAVDEDRAGMVYRYQQQLEQQAPQGPSGMPRGYSQSEMALGVPGAQARDRGMMGGGSMSGLSMGGGSMGGGVFGGEMPARGERAAAGSDMDTGGYGENAAMLGARPGGPGEAAMPSRGNQAAAAAPAGYLTSLDVELPARGHEYLFTTPRGETEITAQSISQESLSRLSVIGIIVAAALVVWLLARLYIRTRHYRIVRIASAAALVVLGVALLVTGTTPLYALIALVAAVAIAMQAVSR